jgi:hypothetical protein
MAPKDKKYLFVFHPENKPLYLPHEQVVQVKRKEQADEDESDKELYTLGQINAIRRCSAYFSSSFDISADHVHHIWPDNLHGISVTTLRFLVRKLAMSTIVSTPQATNQSDEEKLRTLCEICFGIWFLECDTRPFQDFAASILEGWQQGASRISELQKKQLAIIAFVLGGDQNRNLKSYLEDVVWHSSAEVDCAIDDLRGWIDGRRDLFLHH